MKKILILIFITLPILSFSQSNINEKIVGNHLLSLQWISWDYFGDAKIMSTKEENLYEIDGIQKSKENDDYLKIKGTLTALSDKHLIFNGTIETSVYHINNGKPCIRNGKFNFKVSGQRKYWRLQEMNNPCDGVADYVDIYFTKRK